ncbi:MAG: hypothetical protein WC360_08655 [Opitutales bacterium]|jgi:hypothetical protein
MSNRALIFQTGVILDGLLFYRREAEGPRCKRTDTLHLRFFSPLPTEWRARDRLERLVDSIYAAALAPGWTVAFELSHVESAPESMRGMAERFLPVPAQGDAGDDGVSGVDEVA